MRRWAAILILALLLPAAGCDGDGVEVPRPFRPESGGRPILHAICYGPHRDGQRPGEIDPSAAELREDLGLMAPRWKMLRVYGASGFAETLLSLIREDGLDMKVVLGAWIAVEETRDAEGKVLETFPEEAEANRREVAAAIRLAEAYPDVVAAVCVGNETQVDWSAHRSPADVLIRYLREVRRAVRVPVTTADDFSYWVRPESRAVAREVDFLTVYAHPMWNGILLPDALAWLDERLVEVEGTHPGRLLVLGETGWATSVHDEGEQARLIKGRPGEAEQAFFHDQIRAWTEETSRIVFFFEAFDENWKGGPHPAEVEKHWGLYRADRSPKAALRDGG